MKNRTSVKKRERAFVNSVMKKALDTSQRSKNRNGTGHFLSDPMTYAGIVSLSFVPLAVKYYGLESESLKDASFWDIKVPYIIGVGSLALVGNFAIMYSFMRNNVPESVGSFISYHLSKHDSKKYWERFEVALESLRGSPYPELDKLVTRGERLLGERTNTKEAHYLLREARAVIKKKESKKPGLDNEVLPISTEAKEKYPLATRRSYDLLSENAKLRADYFLTDMSILVTSQDRQAELYRNVYESRWFSKGLTDMQTYMLFDDITLSVRKGLVPTANEINAYMSRVLEETKRPAAA